MGIRRLGDAVQDRRPPPYQTRACFCGIVAVTCVFNAPLETARNRSVPMACGPSVDQAGAAELCGGGGDLCRGGGYWTEIPSVCQKTASAMIRVPYWRALRALLERLSGSATTNRSRVW
jgi:hypothetical protein